MNRSDRPNTGNDGRRERRVSRGWSQHGESDGDGHKEAQKGTKVERIRSLVWPAGLCPVFVSLRAFSWQSSVFGVTGKQSERMATKRHKNARKWKVFGLSIGRLVTVSGFCVSSCLFVAILCVW